MLTHFLRQIFPLYTEVERLPSQDSVLSRIRQKHAEYRERARSVEIEWLPFPNVIFTLECQFLHLVLHYVCSSHHALCYNCQRFLICWVDEHHHLFAFILLPTTLWPILLQGTLWLSWSHMPVVAILSQLGTVVAFITHTKGSNLFRCGRQEHTVMSAYMWSLGHTHQNP